MISNSVRAALMMWEWSGHWESYKFRVLGSGFKGDGPRLDLCVESVE